MKKLKKAIQLSLMSAFIGFAGVQHANAKDQVKIGVLTCAAGPKIGLIIGSSERVKCSFLHDQNETEQYVGRFGDLGLDIGFTVGSVIIWTVFAAQDDWAPGSLAGTYVGASAEATAVLGLGANILVGGSAESISLQPLSVQGQAGLNVAIGVSSLKLERVL